MRAPAAAYREKFGRPLVICVTTWWIASTCCPAGAASLTSPAREARASHSARSSTRRPALRDQLVADANPMRAAWDAGSERLLSSTLGLQLTRPGRVGRYARPGFSCPASLQRKLLTTLHRCDPSMKTPLHTLSCTDDEATANTSLFAHSSHESLPDRYYAEGPT